MLAGFLVGTIIGAGLPWILLFTKKASHAVRLPEKGVRFLSFLSVYATALSGGAVVASVSPRFALLIAGASVSTGLVVTSATLSRNREHEPGSSVIAFVISFGPFCITLAIFGAGLVIL